MSNTITDKELKENMEHFINKLDPTKDKIQVLETKETMPLAELLKNMKLNQPNTYFYLEALISYEQTRLSSAKKAMEEMKRNFRMFMIPHQLNQKERDDFRKQIKVLENSLKTAEKRIEEKDNEVKRTLEIVKSVQEEKKELWRMIPKKKETKEEEKKKF